MMMARKTVPDEVKRIHAAFAECAPCIVAGGAIRDSLNGRQIKDVDVFIHGRYKHHVLAKFSNLAFCRGSADRPKRRPSYGSGVPPLAMSAATTRSPYGNTDDCHMANDVDGVYEMPFIKVSASHTSSTDVQVIFLFDDPVQYVNRGFDFGLCKTWYDGDYIHCHGDYLRDASSKTITLVLPPNVIPRVRGNARLERVISHGHRIKSKYPDHRLIIDGCEV